MLHIISLNVFYEQMQILFENTLHVDESELVAVIGANGSGKSTLLSCISGILSPRSGSIEFLGARIENEAPSRIVELGIVQVPEGRRVFPSMSVLENLELGSVIKRAKTKRRENLEFIFDIFPVLRTRRHQAAGTLSGGEQQMLAIGRALMSIPRLLMLDEPSLGLAPLVIEEIYDVFHKLIERQTTILLVEQNAVRALEISGRAYVVSNGRIVLEGESKVLIDNKEVKRAYIGSE